MANPQPIFFDFGDFGLSDAEAPFSKMKNARAGGQMPVANTSQPCSRIGVADRAPTEPPAFGDVAVFVSVTEGPGETVAQG